MSLSGQGEKIQHRRLKQKKVFSFSQSLVPIEHWEGLNLWKKGKVNAPFCSGFILKITSVIQEFFFKSRLLFRILCYSGVLFQIKICYSGVLFQIKIGVIF